jgi:hypothetical protein
MSDINTSSKKNSGSPTPPPTAAGIAPVTVGNPAAAASLAIDQAHLEEFVNPEAQSSVVECRKPPKSSFFTVRPEPGKPWKDRGFYFMLEAEGRDPYLVAPDIAKAKQGDEDTIRPVLIVRYVTMTAEEGLWALKLNPSDGKANAWNTSALNILKLADEGRWVRMVSMKKNYRHQVSKKTLEEVPPKFSDRSFNDLINMAFKDDHVVMSLDHEIWDILENGSNK